MNWLHLCLEHTTFVNHHETIWGLHSHAILHRLVNVTLGHLPGSEWNENPFRSKSHHSAFWNAFVFILVVILNHYLFYFAFKLNIYYVSYKTGKLYIIGNKFAHYTAALIGTFPEKCTLYSTIHTHQYTSINAVTLPTMAWAVWQLNTGLYIRLQTYLQHLNKPCQHVLRSGCGCLLLLLILTYFKSLASQKTRPASHIGSLKWKEDYSTSDFSLSHQLTKSTVETRI